MKGDKSIIIIDYKDLLVEPGNPSISEKLSKAFSKSSLGVIAIRGIPSFVETKKEFLPLAYQLAHLPESYLEQHLTDEKSMYNAGWSLGKEQLKKDQPDFHKASFYFNPITDTPGTQEDREKYPASYPINLWPEKGKVDGLELKGKELGALMREVVARLAAHLDVHISNEVGVNCNMGDEMKRTEKVKGRLLYYYPIEKENGENVAEKNDDSWIGWHCDSGFFTALSGDIYVDHDTGDIIPKKDVDPDAGLLIMDRNGEITKVDIPEDCMAIQIGECLQVISGGLVTATPHCVRGISSTWKGDGRKVARISFPCFVDTVPGFELRVPLGSSREEVLDSSVRGCAQIPPLGER